MPWSKKIPVADAERPCACGGTFRVVPNTASYDADGSAMVDLKCDRHGCTWESVGYWTWIW